MTSRRRTSLWIASMLAAIGLIAGACGDSSNSSDTGSSTTASANGGFDAEKSLSLFLIDSPSATAIKSFIPEFEQQTGIKVTVDDKTPYSEAHQKQLLSYKQKAGAYDVAQFDNTFLANFGANKVMTPLDDRLKASTEYDLGDFPKGQQDYGKYDGQTLGLTLSTEPMIQWYRTDIYDELQLKPATTWDEYLANAKAVKAAGKGAGALMGYGPGATWWWMTLVWSFGGQLYDKDFTPTVDTPEAQKATEYMKELFATGPDGAISTNGDEVTSKFVSTDIGSIIQYSGYWGAIRDAAPDFLKKVGTAKMPMGTTDITHLAGWNIGIPADAKHPNNAWKFLEFVLGKANAAKFLDAGAAAIGRNSITSDAAELEKNPYLPLLTIPASSRIERYPQLKVWPEFDKAVNDAITPIVSGEKDVKTGLADLNKALGPILAGEKS